MKQYRLAPLPEDTVTKELEEYSELLRRLLVLRGVTTKKDAEEFLNPDWDLHTHDPFLIHNMDKAVDRILIALEKDEHLVIYTDYDCDGGPAGVILHDFFKKIGYKNFTNYIPHRHDEGYGLNTPAVEQFAKDGVTLLITADLGITDVDSVARAGELGIDVIVTDHHLPLKVEGKQVLPNAFAVINSKQEDDTYPDPMLCGAGVAWKLASAVLQKGRTQGKFADIPAGWEKWLLDLAGLSTIADMVPLKNENRVLARYGLQVLRKSKRVGLLALIKKAGVSQRFFSETDVGFGIAPRINAASRMDHPLRAFELLATEDESEAETLANHLEKLNRQRKGIVGSMVKETHKRMKGRELREVIVIGNPEWAPGLLGLLAGKLAEEYSRPAFVWGRDGNGALKGSVRGDGKVSMVDLMRGSGEALLQFGGHEQSGGFVVSEDHIHTLEEVLSKVYQSMEKKEVEEVCLLDAKLSVSDVNDATYREIERVAPFGQENPAPTFIFSDAVIGEVRRFGKLQEHLEISFPNGHGGSIKAISFFTDDDAFPTVSLLKGEKVELVAVMEKSYFRGRPELRLRIVDILKKEQIGEV